LAGSNVIATAVEMSTAHNQSRPDAVNEYNITDVVCVVILIAYFLHFALSAVAAGFAEDEIVAIWTHWFPGALKSLWANICFWKGIGRPGTALYYLPLYHFFGLNPQAYRIAQISILAASIPIVYHLARLLNIFALNSVFLELNAHYGIASVAELKAEKSLVVNCCRALPRIPNAFGTDTDGPAILLGHYGLGRGTGVNLGVACGPGGMEGAGRGAGVGRGIGVHGCP